MKKTEKKNLRQPVQKKEVPAFSTSNGWQLVLILIGIFIIYSPALNKEFVSYDDNWMIYENPYYNPSVFSHIGEIFSEFYSGQYSPLPTILVGIIRSVAGNETFLYNLVAILLHILNAALACFLVHRLFKNSFYALSVAALFGACTMNVESVSWLSAAFKDGMYAAFFLGALISYTLYISSGKLKFMFASLALFILSFLSKEQAVTLTLCVLCIDFAFARNLLNKRVILEKLPFIFLSVAFGVITIAANQSNRVGLTYTAFSFADRILYACYALGEYVVKIFVPFKMSAFYPYPAPSEFNGWFYFHPLIAAGLIFLFIVTIKKHKLVAFGILFFLSNILFTLALQVVSVRDTIMADRYVYVSSIGLLLIIPYSVQKLSVIFFTWKKFIFSAAALYFVIISFLSFNQTKIWKNTTTLMESSLKKYASPTPMVSLGVEKMNRGDLDGAFDYFNRAIEMFPDYALSYLNRGTIFAQRRQDTLALSDFEKAVRLNLSSANLYANRGGIYINFGKYDLALHDFEQALKLKPNFPQAYYNRAIVHARLNDYNAAIDDYSNYLKQVPGNARVYFDRGKMYELLGQNENALSDFSKAIQLDNTKSIYFVRRCYAYVALGKKEFALSDALTAQKMGELFSSEYIENLKRP
jgi:tetratricopeptide (TPR) repeat protein